MKKYTLIYFILLAYMLGVALPIQAQNTLKKPPISTPESVGMSSERLQRVGTLMQDYLDKDWIPGAVVIIARQGKVVYHEAYGKNGITDKSEMQKDDLFRIASMTKPIISVATMMLYEEGKFLLDEPVSKYIPEFKDAIILQEFNPKDSSYTSTPAKKAITIRHLLTHTSGISYGFMDAKRVGAIYGKAGIPDLATMANTTIGEEVKKLAKLPLLHEPGEGWSYGLNTDVLGYLVEVLSGKKLDVFLQESILGPLQMNDTRFFYNKNAEKRLVKMAYEAKDGTVDFYKDDPQADVANFPVSGAKTYFSGGSGLCSTAEDYFKFCQMILDEGKANGKVFLSPKTIELMTKNQIGDKIMWGGSAKFGLGLSIATPESSLKQLGSAGRLGWGGAFNTTFWIDPKEEVIAVLMTQIYPTTHKEVYDKFENMVYQAIIE
jgi:CubicO group peptidase (beta-lactamase class C family)